MSGDRHHTAPTRFAIASFDKKRGKWGMKAIEAKSVARNHRDFGKVDEEEHDDDW